MKKSNVAYLESERVREDWVGGTYRQNLNGGYDCQIYVAGIQHRKRVRRQSQAKEWLEQMAKGITPLTAGQIHEAQQAFALVLSQGNGKTLLECLRCGLDNDTLKTISLGDAVTKYLDYVAGKCAKQTVDNYRLHLGRVKAFLGADTTLPSINDDNLKGYTDTLTHSPQTFNHFLRAFKAFWNWSIKQRFVVKDPTKYLSYLETKTPSRKFLSIEQTKILLKRTASMYPDLMPYVCLGLFAGIRPAETLRLTKEYIMLNTGYIKVDDNVSKTSTGRLIQMPENLKAWLSLYPVQDKVVYISESPLKKRMREIDGGLVGLSPDCLRHSYATYSIALSQDAAATALAMGHSEQINKLHYRGLVTQKDGQAYFAITPDSTRFMQIQPNVGIRKVTKITK